MIHFSENGVQTPRSLALSEMGSEVDVDQSLNISSFAIAASNTGMNCNGIPATDFQEITDVTDLSRAIVSESIDHARVEVSVNHMNDMTLNDLNDRSDSGTDSFSEQMVSPILVIRYRSYDMAHIGWQVSSRRAIKAW